MISGFPSEYRHALRKIVRAVAVVTIYQRRRSVSNLRSNFASYFFNRSASFVTLRFPRETAKISRPASESVFDRWHTATT